MKTKNFNIDNLASTEKLDTGYLAKIHLPVMSDHMCPNICITLIESRIKAHVLASCLASCRMSLPL